MINITTPALLFPAISLLLLAYTNRFLVVAQLIRSLYQQSKETTDESMKHQIIHLRKRASLIRSMQAVGVASFIFCTITMLALFLQWNAFAAWLFGLSLLLLLSSLSISLWEILISGEALNMQLDGLERKPRRRLEKFRSQ